LRRRSQIWEALNRSYGSCGNSEDKADATRALRGMKSELLSRLGLIRGRAGDFSWPGLTSRLEELGRRGARPWCIVCRSEEGLTSSLKHIFRHRIYMFHLRSPNNSVCDYFRILRPRTPCEWPGAPLPRHGATSNHGIRRRLHSSEPMAWGNPVKFVLRLRSSPDVLARDDQSADVVLWS
jgi:hypothetical protein